MKRLVFIMAVVLTVALAYGQTDLQRMIKLNQEGTVFYNNSNFYGAAQKWEEGLKIARKTEHTESINIFIGNLGVVYKNLGDYPKAISYHEQALRIDRELGDKKGEGADISNLGVVYMDLSDYTKAISYYEQALKIHREIGDRKGEGVNLGNLGIVYRDLGDYPKAISYHEQALKIKREIGDKKGIANNLCNLGVIYKNLGDYQKAISYYEQALKIDRELGDRKGEGSNLSGLGIVYENLGDYPKAISYHEQSLKIQKGIGYKKGIGDNLCNLGVVFTNIGDYQKAISYYEQALKIDRELGDKNGIGDNLTNLGIVYDNIGDYPKALSYYEKALKIHRELGDKRGEGADLTNLGIVYDNLGDYPKALSYYEQALKIDRELGDKNGIAINLCNLGIVYQDLGDYPKAISYFEQALRIDRKLGDKKGEGTDLSNIGVVYQDLGDYPKAISYYEQALEIEKDIGVPTGRVEANIADVWLKRIEIEKAEETYLRLGWPIRLGRLNLVKRNYVKAVEYFDKALKISLQSRNAEFLFANYTGLGQAYEGLEDYGKAKENYENAITMTEEQREGLGEAEKSKFFVVEVHGFKRIQPYEGMVRVSIDMDAFEDGFFYSENLKARVLAEAIAGGQSALEHGLPSRVAKEENGYITKIRGLRKQMEALYRNKAMDTYYEREKELETVKAKQQEFISRLRESYPEYASLNYPQPIKPDWVKLEPDEVLIEFEVTDNETHVFMLNEGKLKTRKVPISREELHELVLQYRGFFEGITKTSQLLGYKPEVGKKLYSLLFGDLLETLTEGSTLIIVPDEFLGILPFEALVTKLPEEEKLGESEYGSFPLGVTYLADKYQISYAQSATSLTLLRTLKKGKVKGENMLVVADPIFSSNDARRKALAHAELSKETINVMGAIADWKDMGVKGVRLREEKLDVSTVADELFPRLEKTAFLAREMKDLFGNRAMLYLGSNAKEDEIAQISFQYYRYLVFATHGILDNTVPWIREPALVLSQVGNPEGYDGFLTMSEVMDLKLDAEVVALTACETGVGKNVSGEGVMGMGRAFQYAGARNVLVSLWSVAETSATELTSTFFKYIKEGKEPKEAIRLARNEIRRKGYEHPFYWASFILFGK